MQLSPACYPFNSGQNYVLLRYLDPTFVMHIISEGNNVILIGKIAWGQMVNGNFWRMIRSRGAKTDLWERWLRFDLKTSRNPDNANLATRGMYGVSQGRWPRMTFERFKCNVRCVLEVSGQRSLWSDLWQKSHIMSPSGQLQQIKSLKTGFVKTSVGGCTCYDVIALWPDLTRSMFKKCCAK